VYTELFSRYTHLVESSIHAGLAEALPGFDMEEFLGLVDAHQDALGAEVGGTAAVASVLRAVAQCAWGVSACDRARQERSWLLLATPPATWTPRCWLPSAARSRPGPPRLLTYRCSTCWCPWPTLTPSRS
jgi:hypothetical protein